jgi:hypothetical protein
MKNWSRLISRSYEWEARPERDLRSNPLRGKGFTLWRRLGGAGFLLTETAAETAFRGSGDRHGRTSERGKVRRFAPFQPPELLQIRFVRSGAERLIGPTPIHPRGL